MADSESVPFWWVVLFILFALGGGAVAVFAVGGSLVSSFAALPLLF